MLLHNIVDLHFYEQLLNDNHNVERYHRNRIDRLVRLLNYVNFKHNKVFYVRFDARFPAWMNVPNDNDLFEGFIAYLIKKLKRAGIDCYYLWCREREESENVHYHAILLLDGSKVKSIYTPLGLAEQVWLNALSSYLGILVSEPGLIDHCQPRNPQHGLHPNGIMLRRGAPDFQENCQCVLGWGIYVCKKSVRGEDHPDGRDFGSSELPHGF